LKIQSNTSNFSSFFSTLAEASIKSDNINFTLPSDETVSDTLLEKFNNLSCNNSTNDRILTQITIEKDSLSAAAGNKVKRKKSFLSRTRSQESILFGMKNNKLLQFASRMMNDSAGGACPTDQGGQGYTLGISIVQGSDNNVYVKELMPGGPGERSGVQIGDQVCSFAASYIRKSNINSFFSK
jgi:C-terminal processing protease CtpA/Prc